jgi:hypothetical protein
VLTGKVITAAAPWLSLSLPMVLVEVAESVEEVVVQPAMKSAKGSEQSHRNAPQKPYRPPPGAGSQRTGFRRPALPDRPCTRSPGWGRLESSAAKGTWGRDRLEAYVLNLFCLSSISLGGEPTATPRGGRRGHASSMHTSGRHVPNSVWCAPKIKSSTKGVSNSNSIHETRRVRAWRGERAAAEDKECAGTAPIPIT